MKDLGAPSGRDAPTMPLLPCPFCGSDKIDTDTDQGTKWGFAYCGPCGTRGPEVRTSYDMAPEAPWRKAAFTEWNRRSVPERGGEMTRAAYRLGFNAAKNQAADKVRRMAIDFLSHGSIDNMDAFDEIALSIRSITHSLSEARKAEGSASKDSGEAKE